METGSDTFSRFDAFILAKNLIFGMKSEKKKKNENKKRERKKAVNFCRRAQFIGIKLKIMIKVL